MELTQGVKFRVLPSVKFKDIGIYIRFIHPLTPQFATKCSLMALMMTDRCEAYPTKQAMSRTVSRWARRRWAMAPRR